MNKTKLMAMAMLLTCFKGYALSNDDQYEALKRGAYQTIQKFKKEILSVKDDDARIYPVQPLKNNCKDYEKGFYGTLSVVFDAKMSIYQMHIRFDNSEIYSATTGLNTISDLNDYESIKFKQLKKINK